MNTSVKFIYEELTNRGIKPFMLALQDGGTILRFMYGGKMRMISGTSPDLTSSTGRTIANMKHVSSVVAADLRIPTPQSELYITREEAVEFLRKYKTVVVKPTDGAHGDNIFTGITTEKTLMNSIALAQKNSEKLLLQQHVLGTDVRVLVIDGKAVAVSERQPAAVIGDGTHTIEELINIENNTNPNRGTRYTKALNKIDMRACQQYLGERMRHIPVKDEHVTVLGVVNIGAGGKAINRTNQVPALLIKQAETFSTQAGIFTCGVDFMYDARVNEWHFIEANSSPSFGLHVWPAEGEAIDVPKIFVDRLLAAYDRENSRILIGRNASIDFINYIEGVPAKVDTGADSSSVWASNITMNDDKTISFCLFDVASPLYTGEVISKKEYNVALVRSATGHMQLRYNTKMLVQIGGKRIYANFNLSDRSKNRYPVLVGRRTLAKKFVVDVTKDNYPEISKKVRAKSEQLKQELKKDPHGFHAKYYGKDVSEL